MKKIWFMLLLALPLALAGCGSDPVQDEILKYVNEEMPKLADKEEKVIKDYESITGQNYTDDQTMYDKLQGTIIPKYNEFISDLEGVEVDSKDLSNIHEGYIEAVNIQGEAFVKMTEAIEKQDSGLIAEANSMLADARKKMRTFQSDIKGLAKEHDVTFEEK
ncbi:hypothetical protein V1498_13870 [Peribacillus sp. SCS-26]|uniref:hypothetical protein n=1 Tax=Paraperibacillus marinus TaxID=3115295 RepID=UPI003905935A